MIKVEDTKKEFPDINYWNHRVLATIDTEVLYFGIYEVYYDKQDVPLLYTEKPIEIINDSIEEMKDDLKLMLECLNKPILWTGERFPEIYKSDSKE